MSLPEDPSLCTMSTLAEYILRTEKLRSSSKLFISFIRPHKPVTTSTVGRWIKSVLSSAGIDTSVFKAHSVTGASVTNAHIRGVPVEEILRTADWTNERTFRKYYLREHIIHEVLVLNIISCYKDVGFGSFKSHNYPIMRSMSKENLKLDKRYLP